MGTILHVFDRDQDVAHLRCRSAKYGRGAGAVDAAVANVGIYRFFTRDYYDCERTD